MGTQIKTFIFTLLLFVVPVMANEADTTKATAEEINEKKVEIFCRVEHPASFIGGNIEMNKWINKNMQYPAECIEKGIEGKVYIQVTVYKSGTLDDVRVLRSAHKLLDAEAIRIVESMPKWIPGRQQGKIVNSQFTIPIVFKLPKK